MNTFCDKCDGKGGVKTFANQVCMPINGRVQCIDWCIHQIVAALNAAGIATLASCCGHGASGRIDLADGRVLTISQAECCPDHPETPNCGFDRNSSHSLGKYVCNCGWIEGEGLK